jgi:hypothetical protein
METHISHMYPTGQVKTLKEIRKRFIGDIYWRVNTQLLPPLNLKLIESFMKCTCTGSVFLKNVGIVIWRRPSQSLASGYLAIGFGISWLTGELGGLIEECQTLPRTPQCGNQLGPQFELSTGLKGSNVQWVAPWFPQKCFRRVCG